MEIKCRDEIVQDIERLIALSNRAIAHLESLNRNVPHELTIQEKREYTNKVYDDIELYDRFKQNAMILLSEASTLPQTEILAVAQTNPQVLPQKAKTNNYDNSFAYTSIDKIVFCGNEYNVRNWADALITITELVVKDSNLKPEAFVDNENLKGKKRNYFSMDPATLKRAYPVSNGCYLELNFSARDIHRISHLIVSECGYNETDFSIIFSKKHGETVVDEPVSALIDDTEFDPEVFDDPIKMLKEIEKQI